MSNKAYEIAFRLGARMDSSMRTAFANANQNLNNMNNNVGNLNSRAGRLTSSMGSMKGAIIGIGAVVASAFAVDKIVDFGKKMIETTADIEAKQEQYIQVMGKMKGSTDKYLNSMSATWNKHPVELQETYMQYVAILKGKGIEEGKAHGIAQQYLDRTVDANAFANEGMADTTARFMGMIKGEYTSVDTAMVNTSASMMSDRGLKEYGKKWANLTAEQQETVKTMVALEQHTSSGVLGQGAREAQSYENNVKMLKNTYNEMLVKFGSPILPIVNDQLRNIVGVIKKIDVDKVIEGFKRFASHLPDIKKVSGALGSVKDVAFGAFSKLSPIFSKAASSLQGAFAKVKTYWTENSAQIIQGALGIINNIRPIFVRIGQVVLNVFRQISEFWSKNGSSYISAMTNVFKVVGTVFNSIIGIVKTVIAIISPFVEQIVAFLLRIVDQLLVFWNENGAQITKAVQNIFAGINKVIQVLAPVILLVLNSVWNNVKGVIQGALKIILGLVKIFASVFTGDWAGMWTGVKQLFSGVIQFLWNLWNLMMMGKLVKGIATIAKAFWGFLKGLGPKIATSVQYYYHLFMDKFYQIGIGILRTITSSVGKIVGVARDAVTRFVTIFQMARTFGVNIFMSIVSAIRGVFSGIFGFIGNTVSSVIGAVLGKVSGFIGSIQGFMGMLWGHISSVFLNIQTAMAAPFNFLQTLVQSVVSAVSGLVGGLFTGVTAAGKGAINALVMAANAMIGGVNKIRLDVPEWVPGIGGQTIGFNLPQIPMLAKGGITTGPTLAMIGEGAEQEAVLPLSKLQALLGGSNKGNSNAQYIYSPSYVVQNNATKKDVEEVSSKGFQEFKRWTKEVQSDEERLSFSKG